MDERSGETEEPSLCFQKLNKEMKFILKKVFSLLALFALFFSTVFLGGKAMAADPSSSYIDVTTITEGGNTVKGNPMVTAVPAPGKQVAKVQFFAKALNEPDANYYPYAPLTKAPYSWNWPTGAPWVPDGEYTLRVDITYSTGEVETVKRNITVANYSAPDYPASPASVDTTARTSSSVTLSWQPSTAQKIFNYVIYQDGQQIGETSSTSYTVNGLTAGNTYQFRVKTKDLYNNESIDDNTIKVLVPADSDSTDPLPSISDIKADGPAGATPGGKGYSGTVNLSVTAMDNDKVTKVEMFVKTLHSPESDYWQFPTVKQSGDTYSTSWLTTSAPEGDVIVKAVAYDSAGQAKTVTKVLLVDNKSDGQKEVTWEPADTPPANRIIGYLAGWSTYGSYEIMSDLDASRLTHLNYAFALISKDLKVVMSDPVQDPKNFAELAKLKAKYPHLKTVIAIGGWGGSANFIESAATAESREIFANSAVDFIVKHGFDGVDLDWEYPVTGGGPGTYPNPADRDNFPLLLKVLREKLDAQGAKDGKHYILSIAGGATAGFANNTQLGLSQQYLDYVQIMTYDIHGTWEPTADYNAPLLDDNGKTYSVDKGVQAYLKAGVPVNKLVMGVPFYGYKYNVTSSKDNGLRQPYNGSGSITYNSLVKNKLLENGYVRYWDDGAKVPYLFNPAESVFITYDDEESMGLKAEYIRDHGLGGAMIWELSQDHGNDLIQSLYDVLKDPIVPVDQVAPVVTAKVSGEQLSDGSYLGVAAVVLSAEDDHSGVEKIEYRLNGGDWQTYAAPVVVSADGKTIVEYHAFDTAGNVSETASLEVAVVTATFENLYKLVEGADIQKGQKTALTAHIRQAEEAKSADKRVEKLQKALEFVSGMQDKHIATTAKQDITAFLQFLLK